MTEREVGKGSGDQESEGRDAKRKQISGCFIIPMCCFFFLLYLMNCYLDSVEFS